ncbi:MAG: biopolymer transporter ExbD [Bacteroidales bacterium]|jgi:biopolymer transport protein ExbD|nr:biopolymer transporter ExbD [Bacteroidales bacterium]
MGKFKQKTKGGTPKISTASLPDVIFMLLFFFMVTTVMRDVELKVKLKIPQDITEAKKIEKKSLVSYIYVGEPRPQFQKIFGTEPRIQLNDAFAKLSDIQSFIEKERAARPESDVPFLTTSLKVDINTKMGIITDLKQELRKANALKINYSGRSKPKS